MNLKAILSDLETFLEDKESIRKQNFDVEYTDYQEYVDTSDLNEKNRLIKLCKEGIQK